jgi:hypothetical protein
MRYAILYDTEKRKWAIIDSAIAGQMVGVIQTAEAAVDHAVAEQELWLRHDPVTERQTRLMP